MTTNAIDAPRIDPGRVVIFDTTLRDGEQSPGASMNIEEKLRIAETLEAMGVDVIEAGFPIASNGDYEAVEAISKIVTESTVCGLAAPGARTSSAPLAPSSRPGASASTRSSPPARST